MTCRLSLISFLLSRHFSQTYSFRVTEVYALLMSRNSSVPGYALQRLALSIQIQTICTFSASLCKRSLHFEQGMNVFLYCFQDFPQFKSIALLATHKIAYTSTKKAVIYFPNVRLYNY